MSIDRNRHVLDHELDISIDHDAFPIKNLQALGYLPRGIFQLARVVRAKENEELRNRPTPTVIFSFGGEPELTSYFNWFALSLTNYLRLVALIDIVNTRKWDTRQISKNAEDVKLHCAHYTKGIVPEVVEWRNKIAAHPALTDPRRDNIALLEYSVMDNLAFMNPYFTAGAIQWGTEGHETNIPTWALTEVFERLVPRFWPGARIPPHINPDSPSS